MSAGLRCLTFTQDLSRWRPATPSALCALPSPQQEERQPQLLSVTHAEVKKRRASCPPAPVTVRHEEVGDPAWQPGVGVSVCLLLGELTQ